MFVEKRTYTLDGLINRGLTSGIISSLAKGWAYISKGLKTGGGALTWDFTVSLHVKPQVNLVPRASNSRPKKRKNDPGNKVTLKCHQNKKYLRRLISTFLY